MYVVPPLFVVRLADEPPVVGFTMNRFAGYPAAVRRAMSAAVPEMVFARFPTWPRCSRVAVVLSVVEFNPVWMIGMAFWPARPALP